MPAKRTITRHTADENRYKPTSHTVKVANGEQPVFLDVSGRLGARVLVIEPHPGTLIDAANFDSLRGRFADYLAEKEVERQERELKKKAKSPDAAMQVSVVSPGAGSKLPDGDYLLTGYHATTKTPLLRKPDGSTTGVNPSDLGRVKVLNRLGETGWEQWREIKDAWWTASNAWHAFSDLQPQNYYLRPRRGQELELSSYRINENDVTYVAWTLLSESELFAAVVGTMQYAAADLDTLGEKLLDVLHPQAGQQGLLVDEKDNPVRQISFLPSNKRDGLGHGADLFLGLDADEFVKVRDAYRQAEAAEKTFLAKHAYV